VDARRAAIASRYGPRFRCVASSDCVKRQRGSEIAGSSARWRAKAAASAQAITPLRADRVAGRAQMDANQQIGARQASGARCASPSRASLSRVGRTRNEKSGAPRAGAWCGAVRSRARAASTPPQHDRARHGLAAASRNPTASTGDYYRAGH
jgi:hypothetical protein